MDAVELVMQVAAVPSFSSYEDRLHPLVREVAEHVPEAELVIVPDNNVVIRVPGQEGLRPVAISAHLDKINHFDMTEPEPLPVTRDGEFVVGQMDDSAGVGICLSLMLASRDRAFPPLEVLLTEMEEGSDKKERPQVMRPGTSELPGLVGAKRVAEHLIDHERIPAAVIVVDTSPALEGEPGMALYSTFWERADLFCDGADPEPTPELAAATDRWRDCFMRIDPSIVPASRCNDYLAFGQCFNEASSRPVPSLAIEPSIWPRHTINERVRAADILAVETVVVDVLEHYARTEGTLGEWEGEMAP